MYSASKLALNRLVKSAEELFVGTKFKRVGSKVKVITNDVNRPNVIIHPKSIIGLMPLNIKDRKANIVVNTV